MRLEPTTQRHLPFTVPGLGFLVLTTLTPAPGGVAPEEARASPRPGTVPWVSGVEYAYRWVYERKKIGETRFRVEDLKGTPGEGRSPERYRLLSSLHYTRDGSSQRLRQDVTLDGNWSLLNYRSLSFLHDIRGGKASQDALGWREGERLVTEVIHNRRESTRTRVELPLSGNTRVILANAVETWAIHLARLPRANDLPRVSFAYPEFARVYDVRFEFEGIETVKLAGGAAPRCRHFKFRSAEKQLQGEVWIDPDGRLLRYRQGPLAIQLESINGSKPKETAPLPRRVPPGSGK